MSLFDDDNAVERQASSAPNPKVISLDERKLQSERDKKIQGGTVIYAGDLKRSGPPAAVNFTHTAEVVPH